MFKHVWNINETHIIKYKILSWMKFFYFSSICDLNTWYPCLNNTNLWKKKLHDYYCQIMTQKFINIYIFQILALGILTNLKSQIEMWLLERFQNKFYLLDKWISWELGCFSTKFFYVSYFDCQNVQWKKMERIWK